ncbi:MAG: ATP-grasp domain-containing protein [Bacteroidales bacterium]|nr:ATP-grasp domain-containing protein [Bacteroidales bacterium]
MDMQSDKSKQNQPRIGILFLGGAKRVSMARFFDRAASELGYSAEIYSYELDRHVPISIVAKVIVGKKWSDPYLYKDLEQVIEKHDISVVVPFVDPAIEVAQNLADKVLPREIFVPGCQGDINHDLYYKDRAHLRFQSAQIPVPKAYEIVKALSTGLTMEIPPIEAFPLIAKPKAGSASKGIHIIDTPEQLKALSRIEDYLIQEYIADREEYSVDCYVSVRTGQPLAIVPRKRIEVSGGEAMRTETVIAPEVYDLAKLTIERLQLRGAITIQILHDRKRDRYLLMEINPRLGGGAVCSVCAGADIPKLILLETLAHSPAPVCYRPYTEIARYPQEVVFYN